MEKEGLSFKKYKCMILLGDSSYSLYLLHTILISLLLKVFTYMGIIQLGILSAIISFAFILFFCIVISIAFHKKIEKPLLKYLQEKIL